MKKTEILMPSNCEVLKEEVATAVYGGVGPIEIMGIIAVGLEFGFTAAGEYARSIWPNGIPDWAKPALMQVFTYPIGWSLFMDAYNG